MLPVFTTVKRLANTQIADINFGSRFAVIINVKLTHYDQTRSNNPNEAGEEGEAP